MNIRRILLPTIKNNGKRKFMALISFESCIPYDRPYRSWTWFYVDFPLLHLAFNNSNSRGRSSFCTFLPPVPFPQQKLNIYKSLWMTLHQLSMSQKLIRLLNQQKSLNPKQQKKKIDKKEHLEISITLITINKNSIDNLSRTMANVFARWKLKKR